MPLPVLCRRMMKVKRTGLLPLLLCVFLLLAGGCAQSQAKRYQAEFLTLFDTVTKIIGYSDSEAHFKKFADQVHDMIQEYHQLYDIYNDYEGVANIKSINDNAGLSPVEVDRRIIDLLLFAREEYEATGGTVNVAMGSVLKIWHDYREAAIEDPENAQIPPMQDLIEASRHTNIDNMIIDEEASTVYLADPLMRLDVGAVAKGYAVERVAESLERQGVQSLLISVGGNVRAIGGKQTDGEADGDDWSVGIQNPDSSAQNSDLMLLAIRGLSVVTSGIYERYYTVEGVQYHHIISPDTLMPSDFYTQVTVVCRDSGLADALSTAIFNMPLDTARAYIDSLDGAEALWVQKDGSIVCSRGFEGLIKTE